MWDVRTTVGLHNFNLRIFNLRVSNPNKLIVDVLLTRCRISMCQGLGPNKHDEISEIERNRVLDLRKFGPQQYLGPRSLDSGPNLHPQEMKLLKRDETPEDDTPDSESSSARDGTPSQTFASKGSLGDRTPEIDASHIIVDFQWHFPMDFSSGVFPT